MALSNILREPRREITESIVGLAIVGAAVWVDYAFASWLERREGYWPNGHAVTPWPVGMALGIILGILGIIIVVTTHALGTAVCNALETRGVQLRPRKRP